MPFQLSDQQLLIRNYKSFYPVFRVSKKFLKIAPDNALILSEP